MALIEQVCENVNREIQKKKEDDVKLVVFCASFGEA